MYAQEFPSEKGPGEEHLIDTLCDRSFFSNSSSESLHRDSIAHGKDSVDDDVESIQQWFLQYRARAAFAHIIIMGI